MKTSFTQKNTLEEIIKKSKLHPLDIFELDDGQIIVNGNVFPNRAEFDKVLEVARTNIKVNNFFNKLFFWKKKN